MHFYQGNITSFPPLVLLSSFFFLSHPFAFLFSPFPPFVHFLSLLLPFDLVLYMYYVHFICLLFSLFLAQKKMFIQHCVRFFSLHCDSPAVVQPYKRIVALNSRFQSPANPAPSLSHSLLFLFKDMTILRCNPCKSKSLPVRSFKYYLTIDNLHLNTSTLENKIYMAKWPWLVY